MERSKRNGEGEDGGGVPVAGESTSREEVALDHVCEIEVQLE